jgi:uncharacterized protein
MLEMFKNLLPKNVSFYDFFDQVAVIALETSRLFLSLTSETDNFRSKVLRIKELEHEADAVTHQCVRALHQTFITPIDRFDILNVIKNMDDIIDLTDGAAARMQLYEITEIRPEVRDLADVLFRATLELQKTIKFMRDMKNAQLISDSCIQLHLFENEADVIHRNAVSRLFKDDISPVMVIKWKEIFEFVERATDCCEDVANIIEGIMIEAT